MRSLLVVALASFPLVAQATHYVGPGSHATIDDALAVAAPGDVVLVQAGSYAAFRANIGVTIRSLGPVQVGGCVCSAPAGQTLHLVGLDVPQGTVAIAGGRVTLAACHVALSGPQAANSAALAVANADVHLLDCSFTANLTASNASAMSMTGSRVAAVNTSFSVADYSGPQPTVSLSGGQLHISRCSISAAAFNLPGAPGIRAIGNATLWLADSGVYGALGNCPIDAPTATVRLSRTSTSATSGAACTTVQSGPGLLGIEQLSPPQSGSTYALTFRSSPYQWIALHASLDIGTTPLPGFEQPAALALYDFWPVGVYLTDANGTAGVTWNLPAGMFVDTPLWLEAITGMSLPLQVAPLVGGVIR